MDPIRAFSAFRLELLCEGYQVLQWEAFSIWQISA